MSYTTPVVLTCKVTGLQQKLYYRPYIDKLIALHGSLEKVQENYRARGAANKKPADKPTTIVAAKVPLKDTTFTGIHKQYSGGKTIDGDDITVNVYESK